MIWRAWSLVAGAPVGALGAWAFAGPSTIALEIGAAAGGLLLLVVVLVIVRLRDDEPARGPHLAAACSVGLLALPALAARALLLAPGPAWWLAGVVLALAASLYRGARQSGPSGGLSRQLLVGVVAVAAGLVGVTGVAAALAAWGATEVGVEERRAAAIYEMDAAVVTRPLPRCARAPAQVRVLLDTGARPRVSEDGRYVWFDAPVDGVRQVKRLERATGSVVCWTCDEPGNNLRPYAGNHASGVVFETDRHATWLDPTNTELHLARGRGEEPKWPSRRLTYAPGPDDHALFAPGGGIVAWSQRRDGRYQVVTARLRSAHGGIGLGPAGLLASGGAAWTAPIAWSPDARSLVVVRGNPLRPLPARGIDFATGRRAPLGDEVAGGGAAAFNADGGWVVVASARRSLAAGLLPPQLGFALAPLAVAIERSAPLYRATELRVGEPWGEGAQLELGGLAEWGAPSGVSLVRDEHVIVLGQRRTQGGVTEERLVEITLDCAPGERRAIARREGE